MAAGAVGIGSALGAPVFGALADRHGQRPVLLVAAVLNALAVMALIGTAWVPANGSFPAALVVAAFLAGATCPQVGPLARVRWMALTSRNGGKARRPGPGYSFVLRGYGRRTDLCPGPGPGGDPRQPGGPLAAAGTGRCYDHDAGSCFCRAPHPQSGAFEAGHRNRGREDPCRRCPARPGDGGHGHVLRLHADGPEFFFRQLRHLRNRRAAVCGDGPELRRCCPVCGLLAQAVQACGPLDGQRGRDGGPLRCCLWCRTRWAGWSVCCWSWDCRWGPSWSLSLPSAESLALQRGWERSMTALASGIVAGTALGAFLAGQLAQAHGYRGGFCGACCCCECPVCARCGRCGFAPAPPAPRVESLGPPES